MKELKQHIFEKLKVTKHSMDNSDTIFDNIVHRTQRMSKSSFKSMLRDYGKTFELDRIYGMDLPIYSEFNYQVHSLWYRALDRTINFEFYDPNKQKLISRSVDDMDPFLEILGKGDIDKGNDVIWEIYDMMLNQ